jgi:predicted TIM-barrel fold metal-dependent hydrolase
LISGEISHNPARSSSVGPDKAVFATDTPLGPNKPAIDALNKLDISVADRRKIFAGNAAKLLRRDS